MYIVRCVLRRISCLLFWLGCFHSSVDCAMRTGRPTSGRCTTLSTKLWQLQVCTRPVSHWWVTGACDGFMRLHRSSWITAYDVDDICCLLLDCFVSWAVPLTTILLLLLLHPFNGLFSRITWVSQYQKGKTSLDLNKARDDGVLGWQWHQLDHMQTICTSLQTDNHTDTSSLNFYRPGALPDAQPTVSKDWRQSSINPSN